MQPGPKADHRHLRVATAIGAVGLLLHAAGRIAATTPAAVHLRAGASFLLLAAIAVLLTALRPGAAAGIVREGLLVGTAVAATTWVLALAHPWTDGLLPLDVAIGILVTAALTIAAMLASARMSQSPATPEPLRWLPSGFAFLVVASIVDIVDVAGYPVPMAGVVTGVSAGVGLGAMLLIGLLPAAKRLSPTIPGPAQVDRPARLLALGSVCGAPLAAGAQATRGMLDPTSSLVAGGVLAVAAMVYLHGILGDLRALQHHAGSDELTKLPNRTAFRDHLTAAIARASMESGELCVLFCDLDRFKVVNDSLGHDAGNRLLTTVADRIRISIPASAIAARLGGDEFAVLLPGADAKAATTVAHRILDRIAEPISVEGRTTQVRVSVGISRFPYDGRDAAELLRAADTAMYEAKAAGRHRTHVHTDELRTKALARFSIESDLHRALVRRELRLVYQPRVAFDGTVVGAEALLRWHHPEYRAVPPTEFIPVAEESGLIVGLGRFALEEACRAAAAWKASGIDHLTISVNISARQFEVGGLSDVVGSIMRQTGADPSWIELELTESLAHNDRDAVRETLHELRAMGIRCAMDDFGTGYTGLGYLDEFPLDAVKVDRSFIQGIDLRREDDDEVESGSVVRAVLALARAFRLHVIAEGVETRAQLDFLAAEGCDELQGYLFSAPLEHAEFERLLWEERTGRRHRLSEITAAPAEEARILPFRKLG